MSKLFIEDKNDLRVPVAELGLINQKEQAIFGNGERDLILRTKGNIKVQVGSTFYDLTFSGGNTDGSGDGTFAGVTIVDTESDLLTLEYPGDGNLIYVQDTKTFYVTQGGLYISTNRVNEDKKIYLSYTESQSLTGEEKKLVSLNSGTILNSINDVSTFNIDDVYGGMVVFAVEQGRHYRLVDVANPTLLLSWRELYFTTSGGTLTGGLIIDANQGFQILRAFEKDVLAVGETEYSGIYLGENYDRGLAIWQNSKGVFISSQASTNSSIKFQTAGVTSLILDGKSVGIGSIDYNYSLNVDGLSYFAAKMYLGRGTGSRDFVSGQNGVGFDLSKDSDGKWVLEIDKLIVRGDSQLTDEEYETQPVNGSLILNSSIRFKSVKLLEQVPVFVRKQVAGKYTPGGAVMPLEDKSRRVNLFLSDPENYGVPDSPKTIRPFTLAFGIGDLTDSNTPVGYTTKNKDLDGNLADIVGTHNFNGSEYVEAPNGDYVKVDTINIYSITSDITASISVGDLFYYKQWKADKKSLKTVYAEVTSIDGDAMDFFVYGGQQLTVQDSLIKIGNVNDPECMIDINAFDSTNPFISVMSEIESFNDFVENIFYEDTNTLDEGIVSPTLIKQKQIRVKQGFLTGLIDEALGLEGAPEVGLYSDNAYIQGNLVGKKVVFGTQLNFEDDILTIVDLETIKSRNITGINGLTGGGNLFASDIQIAHGTSNWSNKETLTGGTVISNLLVDGYGHVTDWATRVLTTTQIAEGINQYYTNARVDNRIQIQKGVANGLAPLDANAKLDVAYLPDSILGGVRYQGLYNMPDNNPPLPDVSNKGFYYIVNVAGFKDGVDYQVGDWIISDGVTWGKVDNSDAVTSIFGRIGNVTANAGDYNTSLVTEDEDYLYFTNARVQAFGDTRYSLIGHTHPWSSITSKPTTRDGYGITDVYLKSETDALIAGIGIGNYYTKTQSDARFAPISHTHLWAQITDRPTQLSQFTNNLGNYGNWITAAQGNGLYQPLENQRLSKNNLVEFTGVNILAGGDLTIYSNGADIGDIVYCTNIDGVITEKHRLWDNGPGSLYYRYNGGASGGYLIHSGNFTTWAQEKENQRLSTTNNVTFNNLILSGTLTIGAASGYNPANVDKVLIGKSGDDTVHWNSLAVFKATTLGLKSAAFMDASISHLAVDQVVARDAAGDMGANDVFIGRKGAYIANLLDQKADARYLTGSRDLNDYIGIGLYELETAGGTISNVPGGIAQNNNIAFVSIGSAGRNTQLYSPYSENGLYIRKRYNANQGTAWDRFLLDSETNAGAANGTIARRNANGYLYATYFNMSTPAVDELSMTDFVTTAADGFLRRNSKAHVQSFLNLGAAAYMNYSGENGWTPGTLVQYNPSGFIRTGSKNFPQGGDLQYLYGSKPGDDWIWAFDKGTVQSWLGVDTSKQWKYGSGIKQMNDVQGFESYVYTSGAVGNNEPEIFSQIITFGTENGSITTQLGSYFGTESNFYLRSKHDTPGTYKPWRKIALEPWLTLQYVTDNYRNSTTNPIGVHQWVTPGATPTISLAIGDNDTGFQSGGDGVIAFMSNGGELYRLSDAGSIKNFLSLNTQHAPTFSGLSLNGNLNMNSNLNLHSTATNYFFNGGYDNATYSQYNVGLRLWYGFGITSYDNVTRGFYDSRTGVWDVKGDFRIDGGSVTDKVRRWQSDSHFGTYWLNNSWNGTYWRLSSNHPNGVSVEHADVWGTQRYDATALTTTPAWIMAYDPTNTVWKPTSADAIRSYLGMQEEAKYHRYGGFGTDANTVAEHTSTFTYAANAPWNGFLGYFGANGYGLQINGSYGGGDNLSFRQRNGDAGQWKTWYHFIHSGNIAGQVVENITTPTSGYKHVGAWGVGTTANGAILVNSAYTADNWQGVGVNWADDSKGTNFNDILTIGDGWVGRTNPNQLGVVMGLGASAFTAETLDSVAARNNNLYRTLSIRDANVLEMWNDAGPYLAARINMRGDTLHKYVSRLSDSAALPWRENWWDGEKYHTFLAQTDGILSSSRLKVGGGTGKSYNQATIELLGNEAIPPRIGFHMQGVVASSISIATDGALEILNNPGTGWENLRANSLQAYGVSSLAVRADGGRAKLDFTDTGYGYSLSGKYWTFWNNAQEHYGITNDYQGPGAQLSIISAQASGSIRFYTGMNTTINRAYERMSIDGSGLVTVQQSLFVNGELKIGTNASTIIMGDNDETERRIHCNSNRVGFLNSGGGWGSYCDNTGNWLSDFAVAGQRLYAGFDSGVNGSVSASNWFRSSGASGWYSSDFQGGIFMQDTYWVRIYGSKAFWVDAEARVVNTLTIDKNGSTATILFGTAPGGNDPAWIRHYENPSNTGIMQFSASDDNAGNDGFEFGGASGGNFTRTIWFDTNGNASYNGSISAGGGFYDTSDARLKSMTTFKYDARSIQTHTYFKSGNLETGYLAQDVLAIMPHAVKEGQDGYLTLSYNQVLVAKIANLEEDVRELQNKLKYYGLE